MNESRTCTKDCEPILDVVDLSKEPQISHEYTKEHLVELKKKYPDVGICDKIDCQFTDRDHEIFYKYDQRVRNQEKRGEIRVMHEWTNCNSEFETVRIFEWFNGKKWITLTQ